MTDYSLNSAHNVNSFALGIGGKGSHTTAAATQGRAETLGGASDPRGSLWNGFNISNWNGAPVYQEGEHILEYTI